MSAHLSEPFNFREPSETELDTGRFKQFTSAAYDATKQELYLRFSSCEVYRYFDVPPELYRAFLDADSKGRYFASALRDRFRSERLARLELVKNQTAT